MTLRKLAVTAIVAPASVLWLIAFQQRPPARSQAAPAPRSGALSFRVVFGYQRSALKTYDGSVSVNGGTLRSLEPWRFLQNDALTGANSWKLTIHRVVFENQPDLPQSMAGGGQAQNLVPAGLLVTVDSAASSTNFQTRQGNFSVPIRELAYGRVLSFLEGDVQVERIPAAERVSPQNAEEHDYPSLCVTRGGQVWTAWQAYQDRGDHVYAQREGGVPVRLTTEKGDVFRTSVAEDAEGRIHVAWSERQGQRWNLYERIFDGNNWTSRAQITRANTPQLLP